MPGRKPLDPIKGKMSKAETDKRYIEKLRKDPERLAARRKYLREWEAKKRASLTPEQRKAKDRKANASRMRGVTLVMCDMCHLPRRINHICIVSLVYAGLRPYSKKERPYVPPRIKPEKVTIPQRWPYGGTEWPIPVVAKFVPDGLSENIRADLGQELCARLITGEIKEEELPLVSKRVLKQTWGAFSVSLDAPVRGYDGDLKIGDTIEASPEIRTNA